MKILNSLILSLCLLFAFGIVLAQETAAVDENVTAADLGVSESTLLPDSPFYFFKNMGRAIQSAVTLDPIKKAALREKFANEKLIELKKMVEKTGNVEAVTKATENYQKEVENVKKAVDKIKERAGENEQVDKFLNKFVQQQTLHQSILQKLETKVSTTTFEKIQEAREQHLEKFGEVMQKLETNKEKAQERIQNGLDNIKDLGTTTEQTMIRIKDRVMEKIGTDNTKEACITVWKPVCGKDNRTYSNECFAKTAGTEVASDGACDTAKEQLQNRIQELKNQIQKLTPQPTTGNTQ